VRIVRIAAAHNRVTTLPQMLTAGVGRASIAHRVRRGRLYRFHRGVYLLEPPEMAARITLLTAALAACGDGALLSHGSAVEVWGLRDEQPREALVDVTVIGRNIGERCGIRRHRAVALDPIDVRTHRQVRLTAVARTILDLATQWPAAELEQAIAEAERRRLVTVRGLSAVLARYPSHPGARRLRAILELSGGPALTRSGGERRLLKLVRQAGITKPLVNTHAVGYELDLLWPAAKLVVEVDGYDFHSDRAAFERDRRRDASLVAAGYRVIRFTGRQVSTEPLAVVARIAQALGDAAA
jgi:very-short-patch-repair endonuclease/predicted transcriptional regulator of viral defense system